MLSASAGNSGSKNKPKTIDNIENVSQRNSPQKMPRSTLLGHSGSQYKDSGTCISMCLRGYSQKPIKNRLEANKETVKAR